MSKIYNWKEFFTEREQQLIDNCNLYAKNKPAGLPGHNIMIIVAQMSKLLDATQGTFIWESETDKSNS